MTTIELPPEMTVTHAAELRETLLPALATGDAVELDSSHVEQVDAAGLQLICSLHHSASARGINVSFLGGKPASAVQGVAARAGFQRHKGCMQGCLWLGGR